MSIESDITPAYDNLDPGIRDIVRLLFEAGVETFESCEGGEGHCYPEPTVRFAGERQDGFQALAAALGARLPVSYLRRIWTIDDSEPTGPVWEIVFTASQLTPERLAALREHIELTTRERERKSLTCAV